MGDEHKKQRAELAKNYINLSEQLKLTNDLGELGYGVHSARDGVITDTSVRIRGVEERHGPVVPRGFLSLISLADAPKIPADHSGRLELAQWITNPAESAHAACLCQPRLAASLRHGVGQHRGQLRFDGGPAGQSAAA
jgi:hypothetical protein